MLALLQLLANTLINQHVCVNRHGDRERNARESWQRERAIERRHDAEDQQRVNRKRDVRHDAWNEVIQKHHDAGDGDGVDRCPETLREVVRADTWAENVHRDRIATDLHFK